MPDRKEDHVDSTENEPFDWLGKVLQDGLRKIQESEDVLQEKNEKTEEFINERKASINRGARGSAKRFSI